MADQMNERLMAQMIFIVVVVSKAVVVIVIGFRSGAAGCRWKINDARLRQRRRLRQRQRRGKKIENGKENSADLAGSAADSCVGTVQEVDSRKDAEAQRMMENDIVTIVVDAAIAVHRELGPGLLETVYVPRRH
jgi:hypothetical protein